MVKGTKDKWKAKSLYTVYAPEMFDRKEIGEIVGTEKTIPGRVVIVGLNEITGNLTHSYTNLKLKVTSVRGLSAYTSFVGHELQRSYLRTLVRRRRSIVEDVYDVVTKDGVKVRVKTNIYTAVKASESARKALRKGAREEIEKRAKELNFDAFIQEIVFGKLSTKLYGKLRKILPLRRVEIRKTEVKVSVPVEGDGKEIKEEKKEKSEGAASEKKAPSAA